MFGQLGSDMVFGLIGCFIQDEKNKLVWNYLVWSVFHCSRSKKLIDGMLCNKELVQCCVVSEIDLDVFDVMGIGIGKEGLFCRVKNQLIKKINLQNECLRDLNFIENYINFEMLCSGCSLDSKMFLEMYVMLVIKAFVLC
eukprot:TRINITY_DN14797_c0_g1_i2.p4 TRINITY_DN14797_c0_g1~~TRINITY_DN14797_c0_g1_i2.p4  ORF type:complete len:140 (-),score=7.43 TRINITY_DN14797_c0_g1_i2:337-756(-)